MSRIAAPHFSASSPNASQRLRNGYPHRPTLEKDRDEQHEQLTQVIVVFDNQYELGGWSAIRHVVTSPV